MPSLRRSFWFFLPPKEDDGKGPSKLEISKDTFAWILRVMAYSLLAWLSFGGLWYTLYTRLRLLIVRYYLDIPLHLYSSVYGMVFVYTILLVVLTQHNKWFIASRLAVTYVAYMSTLLPIVIWNYRNTRVRGDPSTSCCSMYRIHLLYEFAMYPSMLAIGTCLQVWYYEKCCPCFMTQRDFESMSDSGLSADRSARFGSYVPPSLQAKISWITEPGHRDTYSTPIVRPALGSVNDSVTLISLEESLPYSEPKSDQEFRLNCYSDSSPFDSDTAESEFRRAFCQYFGCLAITLAVWIEFGRMNAEFVDEHYTAVMSGFYLCCFILKRPMRNFSSNMDYWRIEMSNIEVINDLSFEILNEWIISVGYYTFVHIRAIAAGADEKEGLSLFLNFMAATIVHLFIECYMSFVIALQPYFAIMRRFRVRVKDVILGGQPEYQSRTDWSDVPMLGIQEQSGKSGSCSDCWMFARRNAFWMVDFLLREFKPSADYKAFRDRCFIDSQLRLMVAVLTGLIAWVQAVIVFSLNYNLGNHVASFKRESLTLSLRYLLIQILFDLLLFGSIHIWFEKYEGFQSYGPLYRLVRKCKNPRYFFTVLVASSAYVQISLFQ